jgi:hypothetical protein
MERRVAKRQLSVIVRQYSASNQTKNGSSVPREESTIGIRVEGNTVRTRTLPRLLLDILSLKNDVLTSDAAYQILRDLKADFHLSNSRALSENIATPKIVAPAITVDNTGSHEANLHSIQNEVEVLESKGDIVDLTLSGDSDIDEIERNIKQEE